MNHSQMQKTKEKIYENKRISELDDEVCKLNQIIKEQKTTEINLRVKL